MNLLSTIHGGAAEGLKKSSATFDCQWRRIDTEGHTMTRHLVADLWFFVSKTGGSTETWQPDALFLSSALHISLFGSPSRLSFLLLFSSKGFRCCGRTGRSGSTTLAASHISLTGRRSDDIARLDAYFRFCTPSTSRSFWIVGPEDLGREGVWGQRWVVELNGVTR